jgi:predicted dehydrogenase
MRLRVGLVGLGDAWQARYAPALRALADRFEVRAICDQVQHRAELAAAEFQAEAVDGYHALVRREDVDAVMVLSAQWFRSLPILAACEARKAIYCAVGLEMDAEEAHTIRRRVEDAGVAFVAEFPRRHAPATLRLKELIATRLGPPRLLFCHQRSIAEPLARGPGSAPSSHPTFQHLIGQVDWCRYVVDRNRGAGGTEDYRMMSLDFSPPGTLGVGPIAQISCGRYVPADWPEAIAYRPLPALQASCDRGIAFVDLPSMLVWFDEAGRHQETLESERPMGERLLTHFYRAVTSLVRRTGDLEDAYLAISAVQAAGQSHDQGRRVTLA